jgi:preprotein translocase subunit YajC
MACPKIEVRGKRVILLSGFHGTVDSARTAVVIKDADVNSAEELRQSARLHPDAVAFGYVAGRWVPAA